MMLFAVMTAWLAQLAVSSHDRLTGTAESLHGFLFESNE
jgi:hypothetical protein